MLLQIFISAFVMGLLSSFHCLGMCGPLVLALPFNHLPDGKKNLGVILYHLSRIIVYALLGLFFGFAGRKFFIAEYQQILSIALGISILIMLLFYELSKRKFKLQFVEAFTQTLQKFIVNNIQKKSLVSIMAVGAANGLLPCGMVYFALAAAMATSSVQNSGLFMLFFGVGTLPFLILLSRFGFFINISVRNKIKKIVPFFWLFVAMLLILRGLNLGIPYVSPQINNTNDSLINCHQ